MLFVHRRFLHRLDIPSSGLILCALNFEAFWNLQLQLVTGLMAREYVLTSAKWLYSSSRSQNDCYPFDFRLQTPIAPPPHSYPLVEVSLCHGWCCADVREFISKIYATKRRSLPSQVGPRGKASVTDVKVLEHLRRETQAELLDQMS